MINGESGSVDVAVMRFLIFTRSGTDLTEDGTMRYAVWSFRVSAAAMSEAPVPVEKSKSKISVVSAI